MESNKRIRHFRKNILKMTLKEFASKINMSGSNLGNIETGRIRLTERVISDICRVFHVRQNWIEEGIEPIFEENNATLENEISNLYSALSKNSKLFVLGYIQRLLEEESES